MYYDYGPNWEATKRHWRNAWWTRKRCFWCRRIKHVTIDAHHILYPRKPIPAGDVHIIWLRPMCRTCHKIETRIARHHRRHAAPNRKRYSHFIVTYMGRWIINLLVILPIIILYFHYR
jgi:hypothetical protein